ncbi:MAG: NUDIX hydrolase [Bacteroidota bacterium]
METNPWKTLSSEEKYDNPWINVREDQVINPAGGRGIYGVVSFKNKAIGIIPVDSERNTYLVGQYRYALEAYSWEIPMGGGPNNLDILESAKRELKEETGFTATRWQQILHLHTSNSVTDEESFVFLAQDLTAGEAAFEDTEDIRIWKLSLEEAIKLVLEGKITDAISVAGLLAVERWIN